MKKKEKILLLLLPFWSPLIPPLGISCLKGFLQNHNYEVKGIDANVDRRFYDIFESYFNTLRKRIPGNRWGNLYSIGMDVMRHHLAAHLYKGDREEYAALIGELVFKTFYYPCSEILAGELTEIVENFYRQLESYAADLLNREKPSVFGISVFSGTLPASLFAFDLCKRKFPRVKTVMGGGVFSDDLRPGSPNFDLFLEKASSIDKIIVGEGELLFLKMLNGELPGTGKVYGSRDLPGAFFDLNSANLPDFSDFDLEAYPALASYASRSCPFQCSFCSETVSWGRYRRKRGSQVVSELTELYQRYKYQLFLMGDSLLNPVITEIANGFAQSDLSLYWDGYLRVAPPVSLLENTLSWRRGGFYRAQLGIESGSPEVLQLMNKKIAVEQVKTGLASLARAGIKTTTYWMAGHPGETEEDFRKTLDLIEELQDQIWEAECSPFNFYYSGQVNSQGWAKQGKITRLYPEKFDPMLLIPTWALKVEPSREETYDRVIRFTAHCKKLGIPNPYSMYEIYQADQRWKQLHKNAVPPLADFKKKIYIRENKDAKEFIEGKHVHDKKIEWSF